MVYTCKRSFGYRPTDKDLLTGLIASGCRLPSGKDVTRRHRARAE